MIPTLDAGAARQALDAGAVALDLRPSDVFAAGHIPGAVNLVYSPRRLGERAAVVLRPTRDGPRLLLVGPDEAVPPEAWEPIAADLVEAGFAPPVGYLDGGMAAWQAAGYPVATLPLMSHAELAALQPQPAILDVREPFEWAQGVIAGAHCISLGNLPAVLAQGSLPDLAPDQPVAVVCAGGVRSSSAASLLRRHGYEAANLIEGMNGWYQQGRPVVEAGR